MSNVTFFRNIVDVQAHQGMMIDAGALWNRPNDNLMVLVDDDEYITAPFDDKSFYRI